MSPPPAITSPAAQMWAVATYKSPPRSHQGQRIPLTLHKISDQSDMTSKFAPGPSRSHRPPTSHSRAYDPPPPPYTALPQTSTSTPHPRAPPSPRGPLKASLDILPLPLLHWIMRLTLDPAATPSTYASDRAEEVVRRRWGLFRGLRGVDRRFYIVATAILRTHYLASWHDALPPSARGSSDPYPLSAPRFLDRAPSSSRPPQPDLPRPVGPVLDARARETAVFDRFIALRVGRELRAVESSLSEEGEGEDDLFRRLQPAARIEDLLLTLPPGLVVPHLPHSVSGFSSDAAEPGMTSAPGRALPLPHSYLSVILTPLWAQLYVHARPLVLSGADPGGSGGRGRGRELVLEVKRQPRQTVEQVVLSIQTGLEEIDRGTVPWGARLG